MIEFFEARIGDWYIDPIEVLLESKVNGWRRKPARWLAKRDDGGHYSFTVAAVTCLLIDTLSQFEQGVPEGSRTVFKDFIHNNLPAYAGSLSPAIEGFRPPQGSSSNPRHEPLNDVDDVLYTGFRCGILHQAHAPLYCGINPGNRPPAIEASGLATYGTGATSSTTGGDCPVVIVYPTHLFNEVMAYFRAYFASLRDPATHHDTLRDNFKEKFADCSR